MKFKNLRNLSLINSVLPGFICDYEIAATYTISGMSGNLENAEIFFFGQTNTSYTELRYHTNKPIIELTLNSTVELELEFYSIEDRNLFLSSNFQEEYYERKVKPLG